MTTKPTRKQLQMMSERLLKIEIEARTARMEIAAWLDTPQPDASPAPAETLPLPEPKKLTPATDKKHKALSGAWIGAFGRQPTKTEVEQLVILADIYGQDKIISKLYRPDLATIKGPNMAWLEAQLKAGATDPVETTEADKSRSNDQDPGEGDGKPAETESEEPESDGQPATAKVGAAYDGHTVSRAKQKAVHAVKGKGDAKTKLVAKSDTRSMARLPADMSDLKMLLDSADVPYLLAKKADDGAHTVKVKAVYVSRVKRLFGDFAQNVEQTDGCTVFRIGPPKEKNPALFLTAPSSEVKAGAS